jgi:ABC-type transporter Mla subunit MlaD
MQNIPMLSLDHGTVELILIAVTAGALLFQAIVLLAIYLAVRKASRSLLGQFEDLRSSVMPLIYNARELLTKVAPKVEAAVTDIADISQRLRVQVGDVEDVEESAGMILDRVRLQAGRLDAMFTSILNAIDQAGEYVAETVNRPLRQVSGLLASVKAIVESLRSPFPLPRKTRTANDRDNFV